MIFPGYQLTGAEHHSAFTTNHLSDTDKLNTTTAKNNTKT